MICNSIFEETFMSSYRNLFDELEKFKKRTKDLNSHMLSKPIEVFKKENNKEILVSVVTPSYNAERFLTKLYASLKAQTIAKHIEWIIVDDYSTDESARFYEQLNKDNTLGIIKVLKNERNLGAGTALRRGFSAASSNALAWVSADDFYVSEDKLEKDLRMLNEGYDIVFSKFSIIGSDLQNGMATRIPKEVEKITNKYELFAWITMSNFLNGSSVCMKREAYLDTGGMNPFLINVDGDYDLWVRFILLDKKIGFSDSCVFNLVHQEQTSQKLEEVSIGRNVVKLAYIRFLKSNGFHGIDKIFERIYRLFNRDLKGRLIEIAISSGAYKCFPQNLRKKAVRYIIIKVFREGIYREESYEKEYKFVTLLRHNSEEVYSQYVRFKGEVHKLSKEFMETEPFETFSERFSQLNNYDWR